MCTSLSIKSNEGHNFFGRNMDLAYEIEKNGFKEFKRKED